MIGGHCLVCSDRTRHRKLTFFDGSAETPLEGVCYTPTAQPYCAQLREVTCSFLCGSGINISLFHRSFPHDVRDGTGSPGRSFAGSVRSLVSVSDPVFDPPLSFNVRVYRGIVSTD